MDSPIHPPKDFLSVVLTLLISLKITPDVLLAHFVVCYVVILALLLQRNYYAYIIMHCV